MKTRPAGIGNVNADWMGSLPSKLSAMPLKHIAVPGEPSALKNVWLHCRTLEGWTTKLAISMKEKGL